MCHAASAAPAACPHSDETHRVTTFELFFDLVFVFAFTQVTGFMVHEYSFLGVLQGMEPRRPGSGSPALFGGPALYLLASAGFWRRMGGGWKKWRLGTAVLLLVLITAAPPLTSLAALLLITALIAGLVAVESMLYREVRSRIRGAHAA